MKTALAGNECDAKRDSGLFAALVVIVLAAQMVGCGTTKSFTATEQLLVSDAVDSTVAKIDFRPLTGKKVYLDNAFVPSQKGTPNPNPQLVHSEYVSSSLRQQMLAAGVYLCDKREDAEIIVEARLGALGFDGHSVTYGLPASGSLSTAASTLSGSPMIPLIPELSFAKKEAKQGAAKIALFAYERVSLQPVWQSGIARSSSSARDTWVLGMGPLQYGTIYDGTRFAGSRIVKGPVSRLVPHEDDEPEALVDYKRSQVFTELNQEANETETANSPPANGNSVAPAGASAPAGVSAAASPASATGPASNPAATTPTPTTTAGPPTPPPLSGPAPAATAPAAASAKLHLDDKATK